MLSLSYLYLTPPPLHINLEAFERLYFDRKCEDVNGIDPPKGLTEVLDFLPLKFFLILRSANVYSTKCQALKL